MVTQVKFREAIAALRDKLPEVSLTSADLAGPVHAKVFTVAGCTSADLVADLHASLTSAMENGTTLADFRRDFDKAVRQHGWTYNGSRGWRTATIFNTNMRTAHMAGRWQQLVANRANRPFLQYRTVGDARVRPLHRQWDGILRHLDDEFWDTHYPPCGWGCRCTVRPVSQAEVDAQGLKVQTEPFELRTRDVTTTEGEVFDNVPVGIDAGWDHNVGKSWIAPEVALGRKIARLPTYLRGPFADRTISPAFQQALSDRWKAFREGVKATGKPRGDAQILGFLDSATINALAAQVPDLVLESTAVGAFDKKTLHLEGGHKAGSAPQQVWPADWIDALPEHLRDYRAVLWDTAHGSLVIVPRGSFNTTVPRIAIRPNVRTKFGEVMSVVSLGSGSLANLRGREFVLLAGELK